MLAKEQNEIQELINTAIGEGKSLEKVEKQIGMSFIQVGDPDEVKKQWEQAKKEQDSNQRTLEDKIKGRGLYPYDLSGVEKITQKAIRQIEKTPQNKLSIAHDAIQEIDKIIRNAESVYKMLIEEGSIDVHDHFHNELNKAIEQKRQLKEEIDTLNLNAAKQDESNVKVENNKEISKVEPEHSDKSQETKDTSSAVKTSNSEQKKSYYSVKEAADHFGVSESTLYHTLRKIPKEEKHRFYFGRNYRIPIEQLDEFRMLINSNTSRGKEKQSTSRKGRKRHFVIIKNLEELTNVLMKDGYLDEENAMLMKDAFSEEVKPVKEKILWEKDTISLITFIYLADRLVYFDKTQSTNVRNHNTSTKEAEPKEHETGESAEIKYSLVLNENFKELEGSSNPNISKMWTSINDAICELRKQVARRDLKTYKNGEIEDNVSEDYTRREAIIYYFDNREKNITINENIDKKMLEIFYELHKLKSQEIKRSLIKRTQ